MAIAGHKKTSGCVEVYRKNVNRFLLFYVLCYPFQVAFDSLGCANKLVLTSWMKDEMFLPQNQLFGIA